MKSILLKMSTGGTFNLSFPCYVYVLFTFCAMSKCSDFVVLGAIYNVHITETEVVMVMVVLTSGSPSSDCNMIVI